IGEALTSVFPFAAAAMLGVSLGRAVLHPAAGPPWASDGVSAAKSWFFSTPATFVRALLVLALWAGWAIAERRASDRQEAGGAAGHSRGAVRRAAIFAVIFAVSFPIATTDWLMSLTPDWSSTIYFVYVLAGVLVEGVAAVTLAAVLLRERGLL